MVFQMALLSVVLFCMLYARMPVGGLALLIAAVCGLLLLVRHGHRHEHGAFLSVDARAQKSRLNGWNTGWKMFLAVVCLFACIAAESLWVPVYLLAGMSFVTVALGKTPGHYYLTLMTVPAVFILLSCLAILVELAPAPMGVLCLPVGGRFLCVTPQNQHLALRTLLRALGAVSCLYMLSLSTPVSRIIAQLRRVRVPAVVVELMYLIYRYLFVLLETHQQMVHASESRLGYRDARASVKTMLKNSLGLIFISLRRTSDMLAAMEARCYDGEIRFLEHRQGVTRAQGVVSIVLPAGMAVIAVLGNQ